MDPSLKLPASKSCFSLPWFTVITAFTLHIIELPQALPQIRVWSYLCDSEADVDDDDDADG